AVSLVLPGTIAPGQTGNLSLNAASLTKAGSIDAVISFDFISRAVAGTGLGDANLTGGTVNVFGAAYEYARPAVATALSLGNVRAGSSVTRTLAVANTTITDAAFQDDLRVTATSTNANLGLANPLPIAAGTSRNVILTPGAATAGSLNSTLTLAFVSDARGINGLSDLTLASTTVAVTGSVYDLAQPAFSDATLAFGNVRKGGALAARNVAFANTVKTAAAYQDSLGVLATSSSARLALTNPALIAANTSANLVVTPSTAVAGSLASALTVNLTSNANGVAGLSDQALTAGAIAVTGGVYDLAQPTHVAALALGNVRVNALANLAVTNRTLSDAAYQDSLAVAATAAGTRLTLANPGLVAAGAAGNVGVTAAAAGSLADTLTLGFVSNANGVTGLSNATLTSGTVAVTGAAYDLASPSLASATLALGKLRVGATGAVALTNVVQTNAGYQDSLDASVAASNAKLSVAAPGNLAAGASGNVVVTAAKAGVLTDTLALGYVSNANGVTGLSNATLAGGALGVTGTAYDYASASVATGLGLGNRRVGEAANLVVGNAVITAAAYQDDLAVAATGGNAKLTLANPAVIAAGATGAVVVTPIAAGSLADSLSLALTSKALTGTGLSDLSLAPKTVALTGAAYDYANASYASAISLGNVRKGAAVTRSISNAVLTSAAYQDNLLVTASTGATGLTVGAPATAIAAGASGDLSFAVSAVGVLSANVALGLESVALAG
ncbi:MAG: choice-of-anchor D domain-containing protein, partial [Betaproteobacteria bacterium]|nr:choice-of-anchor D domain-containing protein [Betaproteobacteria bacterium]